MFMFVCGVLLVASMALMAPFLQGVMGYPIIDTGLLLGTRGVGMALAMLAAGRMAARSDPRLLLAIGLACCTVSLYYSIDFTSDTAVRTIVWTSMLQGFGLGLMFVPLNMMALSSLPAALRTQGTAMWTLIRNLGSSIGVSIVIANLTNKTILMHARLAESVTPFNQALADPAAAMLDPGTDTGRALLEQIISQQAAIIAYANDFKLMMVMTLLAFPLILLTRVQPIGIQPASSAPPD
jgi:DHA2 family multidrug resistance protein